MKCAAIGTCATAFALGLLVENGFCVHAADYPDQPVRFVVGYTLGGTSDVIARLIGGKLNGLWRQPVVVENHPGAGGNIAAEVVAKSAGDGYTLLLGNNGVLATNTALYDKLNYDPAKDFAPVILVASQPNILVVHPALPVKSVKELIALAKAHPGQLKFASAGGGAAAHLSAELFKAATHVKLVHVPYQGAVPALTDVMIGKDDMMFATASSVIDHLNRGKLRALAVTSTKRMSMLPQLPTVAEAGVPGFEATSWHGVVVSSRTPDALVSRLNADFAKVLQLSDLREKFSGLGMEILGGTPQEFAAYIREEIPKWAKLIKAANVRAE